MDTGAVRQAAVETEEVEYRLGPKRRDYHAPTYYGLPPVKHSHYRWTIGASFFAAGMAGALDLLSTGLRLSRGPEERHLVRTGRYVALAGSVASPLLYIKDLGTSSRWFNMLRIFRPTSLMSVGSWSLAMLGLFNGVAALGQMLEDIGYTRTGITAARISGLLALPPALLVTPYMGSELEETSTPFWAASSPLLPALFVVNNVSNGLSVLELAAALRPQSPQLAGRLTGFACVLGLSELLLLKRIESNWVGTKEGSALRRLRHGLLFRTGPISAGILAALAIRMAFLFRRRPSARLLPAASVATLVAGFFLPAVLLLAGNRSADRPEDYFSLTRSGRSASPVKEVAVKTGVKEKRKMAAGRHARTRWLAIGLAAAALGAIILSVRGTRRGREAPYDLAVA